MGVWGLQISIVGIREQNVAPPRATPKLRTSLGSHFLRCGKVAQKREEHEIALTARLLVSAGDGKKDGTASFHLLDEERFPNSSGSSRHVALGLPNIQPHVQLYGASNRQWHRNPSRKAQLISGWFWRRTARQPSRTLPYAETSAKSKADRTRILWHWLVIRQVDLSAIVLAVRCEERESNHVTFVLLIQRELPHCWQIAVCRPPSSSSDPRLCWVCPSHIPRF